MAFLKVGDTIINTNYIIAVELDQVSISGKCGVAILVASRGGLVQHGPRKFWFEGEAATRLRDYFNNSSNVTELLKSSSPRSQARERRRLWQHPTHKCLPESFEESRKPQAWDDELPDLSDDPPSSSPIGRRPWGPQSPSPLSAENSLGSPEPPIP